MYGKSRKSATPEDSYSEQETVHRREAALKRMLATPHKPQKPKAKPKKIGAGRKPKG